VGDSTFMLLASQYLARGLAADNFCITSTMTTIVVKNAKNGFFPIINKKAYSTQYSKAVAQPSTN
jgi:hypothetical protein